MMKVSTSLNVLDLAIPKTEQVKRAAAAGFQSLDMNYWDHQKEMVQIGWAEEEKWAQAIRAAADECGVRFTQMHGPVHGPTFTSVVLGLTLDSFVELAHRSLRTAAILGVPWVVFHPGNISADGGESYEETLKFNAAFYDRFKPVLEETGVGIALENMIAGPSRRYFSDPAQLAELIDALDHPLIGACWDTGHGHVSSFEQGASIRLLGSRLKATHIQDNDGVKDQHLLPYYGTINWAEVTAALKDVGYAGDFTYETHMSFRMLPDPLRDTKMKFALELGQYVISQ